MNGVKKQNLVNFNNPFTNVTILLWILSILSLFISSYYFPSEITGLTYSINSESSGFISLLLIVSTTLICYSTWSAMSFKYRAFQFAKSFNQQLKEERLKSIHTAKLASVARMAANVAHEINNPLAIISGLGHYLKKITKNSDAIKSLNDIELQVCRIARITKSLKNMSIDYDRENFKKYSLVDIIEQTYGIAANIYQNDQFEFSFIKDDKKDYFVNCSPTDLSQLIYNLFLNSIDAIQNISERWIKIELKEENNSFKIFFTDSGKGLSDKVKDEIFEPFFSTKEIGAALGMGLSISQHIAKIHNGTLKYDSSFSNTTFVLTLPKFETD